MQNKPIFHDADVLICFLEINKADILKKLFSKVIVPEVVYMELNRKKSPLNVKNNLNTLIKDGFVEIEKIEVATPEYYDYTCMIEGYWTDDEPIGFGEAAAIALALKYNGIVASNNLLIMSFCLELNIMTKKEINSIWMILSIILIKSCLKIHLMSIMMNYSKMTARSY